MPCPRTQRPSHKWQGQGSNHRPSEHWPTRCLQVIVYSLINSMKCKKAVEETPHVYLVLKRDLCMDTLLRLKKKWFDLAFVFHLVFLMRSHYPHRDQISVLCEEFEVASHQPQTPLNKSHIFLWIVEIRENSKDLLVTRHLNTSIEHGPPSSSSCLLSSSLLLLLFPELSRGLRKLLHVPLFPRLQSFILVFFLSSCPS